MTLVWLDSYVLRAIYDKLQMLISHIMCRNCRCGTFFPCRWVSKEVIFLTTSPFALATPEIKLGRLRYRPALRKPACFVWKWPNSISKEMGKKASAGEKKSPLVDGRYFKSLSSWWGRASGSPYRTNCGAPSHIDPSALAYHTTKLSFTLPAGRPQK